jgi:hypothetical protein
MEQGGRTTETGGTGLFAGEAWFDPIEVKVPRTRKAMEVGGITE